jgi:hypothetical protein
MLVDSIMQRFLRASRGREHNTVTDKLTMSGALIPSDAMTLLDTGGFFLGLELRTTRQPIKVSYKLL